MQEPGVIDISLYRDEKNPARIVLVENWRNREYLESPLHRQSEHLAAYMQKVLPMLVEEPRFALVELQQRFTSCTDSKD